MTPVDLMTIPAFNGRVRVGVVPRDEVEAVRHAARCLDPMRPFLRNECEGGHMLAISTKERVGSTVTKFAPVPHRPNFMQPVEFERFTGCGVTAATLWFDSPADAMLFTIRFR